MSFAPISSVPKYRPDPHSSITRELPGNVPYAAKLSLFRGFQDSWEGSALSCFERVQEVFQAALSALIQKYFERYGNLMATVRCALSRSCTRHP